MDPFEPEPPEPPRPPRRPSPPSSVPPLPPPPELLRGAPTHVPLTPMMDFFQRRLESLEKELGLEKERARAASNLVAQQEQLRGEVEKHLKELTDNVRRQKTEAESEETKQHARGRIDSLEKRLDEMHQSWVALLKDAVGKQAGDSQAAMHHELAAVAGTINSLIDQIGRWRQETQAFSQALPELKSLSSSLPADARRFEGQVAQMLSQFSVDVREQLAAWQRRQELDSERVNERVQNLAREKAALQKLFEEQNHELRQENLKDRIQRENETSGLIAELAKRVDQLAQSQAQAAKQSEQAQGALARVLESVNTPPKAKDQIIVALEAEKNDLLKALRDRSDTIKRIQEERREVEHSMGESLLKLNGELDAERKNNLTLASRLSELELQIATWKDKLDAQTRLGQDKEAKAAALAAERDGLAKALLEEAARVRALIDERSKSDGEWSGKLGELQQRLAAESEARAKESVNVSELRAQLTTLTEHMTRALQDKDSAQARVAGWDQEREKLLAALREKEEMVAMLNSTFQSMLKK
jgi:chromosome segregation ATPase